VTGPQDDTTQPTGGTPGPSRRVVALAALGHLVAVLAFVALVGRDPVGSRVAAAGTTTTQTSAHTPAPSTSAPVPAKQLPPTPVVPAADNDRAGQELAALAAGLPGPIVLTSPSDWDQWGPEGPPYPGEPVGGVDPDMARCPRLAAGLAAATGVGWSYHTGTLPRGPVGCTWATTPLYYGPEAFNPTYDVYVGFLTGGTTAAQAGRSFFHQQGQSCPYVDVPSVGAGAVLARCEEQGKAEFILTAPDARTPGVWILGARARPDAARSSADVMAALVDGVVGAYG
jgi:hypothetical protein